MVAARHLAPAMPTPTTSAKITAVLGPTNTGKTHLAVERMCAHSSGMMGFPLRLLAREVYDRVVAIKGAPNVALITGEERIEPKGARYYLCTAESMPHAHGAENRDFSFVALDEAQIGADPERGHIFTDRMLNRRGRDETMILGSASLRPVIRDLIPRADIITRPRFSTLSYAGSKKLSRLPPRSAIIAFSIEEVYAVAEMLRRLRGGAAVVMGALSPATRNAQVAMFQAGEVDYLVATDAVGMGLNLDVNHIAFAGLSKYDGRRRRRLTVAEMAQIAGRAGRHQRDGTFGVLAGEGLEFTPEEIHAIEEHRFPDIEAVYWRDSAPDTRNLSALIADLERPPTVPRLLPAPEAIDLSVLKQLAGDPAIAATVKGRGAVERLWEVAALPDFRQMGAEYHARFVTRLWEHLKTPTGRLPKSMVAAEIARLDSMQGDVDTLSARISAVRTWAYISHRPDWAEEAELMALRTRELESRLSDALHNRLRQRFVDKRSSILMRKMGQLPNAADVTLDAARQVLIDGEVIGALHGFRFVAAGDARGVERKMILAAAEKYLGGLMNELANDVAKAEDEAFAVIADAAGRPVVTCNDVAIGQLVKGADILSPTIDTTSVAGALEGEALSAVLGRAAAWVEAQMARHLEGLRTLSTLSKDPVTPGEVRALAVQLVEGLGIVPRRQVADLMKGFDKDLRTTARTAGTHFGALDIYHYAMVKPRASFWRGVLSSVWHGHAMGQMPDESAVHLAEFPFDGEDAARLAGYRRVGEEYLRIDLAERLIKQAHDKRGDAKQFAVDLTYATSLGLSEAGLIALLTDAGFRAIEAPAEGEIPAAPAENSAEAVKPTEPETPAAEAQTPAQTSAELPANAEPQGDDAPVEATSADTADEPPAPEPEIRVGEKGEYKVVGNSFFYEGPKLWFAWGRLPTERGPRQFRPDRSGGQDGDDAGRQNRRKKGGNVGHFKGQKPKGDHQRRTRDDGPPPTKNYVEKPRAQSALAEALGAQLAAARAKSKD